jgi:hypothetical protein
MPHHVIPTIGHTYDVVQAEIFFGCRTTVKFHKLSEAFFSRGFENLLKIHLALSLSWIFFSYFTLSQKSVQS